MNNSEKLSPDMLAQLNDGLIRSAQWSKETDMAKHTLGPWSVVAEDTVIGPRGNVVAECCGYKDPTGCREKQGCRLANARLIAAAPDMYKAHRFNEVVAADWGEVTDLEVARGMLRNIWERSRAAIAPNRGAGPTETGE